ncbi:hypothetical protein A3A14_03645 [Candidatus Daviesbacteria bacterium RIFCSPLOWO2_01_FULL_43_38]|uniref:Molecular chaperone n=2 Tax=Candidatus Daviesiibacteriota TaxID=1752718 RepID=A0A1F5K7W3_9BACT|nr:MAG: Molecular chaperone-like protein [Candidatus Daviesbacteria bacterium GW2011_GWA2_42_7]OGE20422.1 MAG: hypothetical protein A2874_00365 [Candidatus Daviesbacteria bacterium RIFCSPHIGHO2_01_FULL_43_17]OGE37027.1 MAG: hypothetical protein A3E45_02155 [Candidatus Daviesbacteria bacterium RIFCSPHIGHO2_12_FULL_43_11]OGE63904.1 MAG: hypothetical protein A3A14_03645 [Candidatus Daviesbacteria bacterium RIFCSPLOWO2_01_FULL_43_38]OGE70703.1 MAG: hypothetical protein A3J21_03580 [Candidatus Davie
MKYGLDFGTTNSSISVAKNGQVKVVNIDVAALDPRVLRSMLYFLRREIVYDPKIPPERLRMQVFKTGEISYKGESFYLIGQEAVSKYILDNKNRAAGIKRTIFTGRFIDVGTASVDQPRPDPVAEYYEEIDYGTGRLLQALKSSLKTNYKGTTVFGKFYSVEELISMFLKEIKERAEYSLGEKIEEITAGRPVKFSEIESIDKRAESRLEEAYIMAGFKKVVFEFEPVAAARQFVAQNTKKGELVFVFDFGGGTLDTAVVRSSLATSGVACSDVLATDGVYIGGDLLNADIMQAKLWDYFGASSTWGEQHLPMPLHLYEALNSWYSIPSLNNPETMQLLERVSYKNSDISAVGRLMHLIKSNVGFEIYEAIEKAKKRLSEDNEAQIFYNDGSIELDMMITREEFEEIIAQRVEEIKQVVLRTLEKAGIESKQVDKVVRTGGSSLIPVFQEMLENIFGKGKITLFETFTSIASGLALE